MTQAREAILARVRAALEHPSHIPEAPAGVAAHIEAQLKAVMPADARGLAEQFKKEVEAVSGECYVLSSIRSAAEKLEDLLKAAPVADLALDGDPLSRAAAEKLAAAATFDASALPPEERRARLAVTPAGLITADFGIADTGTLVHRFDEARSGWASVLPETIYVLLPAERLLPHMYAFAALPDHSSHKNLVMITGPSRTADIEKILILGAHGPKRLVVLIMME